MAKIPVIQISVEREHPLDPRVKLLLSEYLIEEFIQEYEPIREEILKQKKLKNAFAILQQFADHILFFHEEPASRVVLFLPLDLDDKMLTAIMTGDYLNAYYQSIAKRAKQNLKKKKMRALFTPLAITN